MRQDNFFARFNIDPLAFDRSGLNWPELEEVARCYEEIRPSLEPLAKYAAERLLKCPEVHSINYRIKDADHLVEKIIRKRLTGYPHDITCDNYTEHITDLIGVRVLHLFKEDWTAIHAYLKEHWDFAEQPTAFYRHGDADRTVSVHLPLQ